jgi:hypothetical protein
MSRNRDIFTLPYQVRIRINIWYDNFSHNSRVVFRTSWHSPRHRQFRMKDPRFIAPSGIHSKTLLAFYYPSFDEHVQTALPVLYSSHVFNNMGLYNTSYSMTWT